MKKEIIYSRIIVATGPNLNIEAEMCTCLLSWNGYTIQASKTAIASIQASGKSKYAYILYSAVHISWLGLFVPHSTIKFIRFNTRLKMHEPNKNRHQPNVGKLRKFVQIVCWIYLCNNTIYTHFESIGHIELIGAIRIDSKTKNEKSKNWSLFLLCFASLRGGSSASFFYRFIYFFFSLNVYIDG